MMVERRPTMKGVLSALALTVLLAAPALAENYMVFPPGGDPYFWSVNPAPNGATVYQWGGNRPNNLTTIMPGPNGSITLHDMTNGGFTNIYPPLPPDPGMGVDDLDLFMMQDEADFNRQMQELLRD